MDGIEWAAQAMSAARIRVDTATQNIAGASADAFRKIRLHGTLRANGIAMTRSIEGSQGALRRTGRDLDLAIAGPGSFLVRTPSGALERTRSGAFYRDRSGHLADAQGRVLVGPGGAVTMTAGGKVDADLLSRTSLPRGSHVQSGFLESSNVDTIREMVDLIAAQRSFETASKVLTAIDGAREKSATQIALVKG